MPVLAFLASRMVLTVILGILGIAATYVLGHVIEKAGDEVEDVADSLGRLLSPTVIVGTLLFLYLLRRKG